jgi:hypothetical protein
MAKLETLPNELLLSFFEFLNTAHLFQAFYGLNFHFNQLLYVHFRFHQLSFQSIPKKIFDIICQQYLPSLIDQIRSLYIANDTTYNFTFNRFIHLKLLSLYRIYRPKVKDTWLLGTSVVSSSIEYLSIKNIDGYSVTLPHLFNITPRLRQLNINVICWRKYGQSDIIFSSIKSLKTSFSDNANLMKDLFKKMPNLCSLKLETRNIRMNGYNWEKLFVNHLPKLKIFRLKMIFSRTFKIHILCY